MTAIVRRLREDSGQDLIEYALILPLLLLLFIGIIEFGMIIFSYDTIANAAREGARVGIISGRTDAQVSTATRQLTLGLDQSALNVTVDRSNPEAIRVIVQYNAPLLTGVFVQSIGGSSSVPLQATATMRYE